MYYMPHYHVDAALAGIENGVGDETQGIYLVWPKWTINRLPVRTTRKRAHTHPSSGRISTLIKLNNGEGATKHRAMTRQYVPICGKISTISSSFPTPPFSSCVPPPPTVVAEREFRRISSRKNSSHHRGGGVILRVTRRYDT